MPTKKKKTNTKKKTTAKKTNCKEKNFSLNNQFGFTTPDPKFFNYVLAVLVAVVVLVTTFYIGMVLGRAFTASQTFQAGWQAANEKIKETGLIPEEAEEITSVRGTVEKIEGNTLTVSVNQVVANPLDRQAPTTRKVTVNENTALVKRTEKPMEEYLAEEEAYFEALEEAENEENLPPAPQSYTEETMTLQDLSAGDRIKITAEENIKYAEEFTASQIVKTVSPELEEELEEGEI